MRCTTGSRAISGGRRDGRPVSGLLTDGRLPPGWSSRDLALARWRSGAQGRATWSPRVGGKRAGPHHLPAAADCDHALAFIRLVAILGLLGLRIFEATGADISDLGDEHGHRVLRLCGKGTKVVLVPLPPAVGRAIDRAIGAMASGPILLSSLGTRMDRHAATPPAPAARGVPVRRHHGQRTLNRQPRMGAFADSTSGSPPGSPSSRWTSPNPAATCGTTWPWLVD